MNGLLVDNNPQYTTRAPPATAQMTPPDGAPTAQPRRAGTHQGARPRELGQGSGADHRGRARTRNASPSLAMLPSST
jgi:hypothetical protein